MHSYPTLFTILALHTFGSYAAPTPSKIGNILGSIFGSSSSSSGSGLATVSSDFISTNIIRPIEFSRIAYCPSSKVQDLSCGAFCDIFGGNVEVYQVGGDDGKIPFYYIAHDAEEERIVVAHEGTDPDNILSLLNDVQFVLTDLNATRFPSASGKNVEVHDGFQKTFERTADGILAGVQQGLQQFGVSKVLVTGHSLGAAVASLDAMMLRQELDPSVSITTTTFGLPRVGNQAWADFVDSKLLNSYTFVTNQNDPVPRVPFENLGFVHPQGEIHITAVDATTGSPGPNDVVSCPGQDNESCSSGISLIHFSVANHLGPYFNGIRLTSNGGC